METTLLLFCICVLGMVGGHLIARKEIKNLKKTIEYNDKYIVYLEKKLEIKK